MNPRAACPSLCRSLPQAKAGPDSSRHRNCATPDRPSETHPSEPAPAPIWTCLDLSDAICPDLNFSPRFISGALGFPVLSRLVPPCPASSSFVQPPVTRPLSLRSPPVTRPFLSDSLRHSLRQPAETGAIGGNPALYEAIGEKIAFQPHGPVTGSNRTVTISNL